MIEKLEIYKCIVCGNEEKSAGDIVGKLKLIESSPQALYLVDQEIGLRIFTPPVPTEGDQK